MDYEYSWGTSRGISSRMKVTNATGTRGYSLKHHNHIKYIRGTSKELSKQPISYANQCNSRIMRTGIGL